MKKQILHFNEVAFDSGVSKAKQHQSVVQQLLDEHYRLGDLFPLVDAKVAFEILEGGVASYKEKIVDAIPAQEIAKGLRMKKEAMIENIEFPDLSSINSICRDSISIVREYSGRNLVAILDGKAIVDPKKVEEAQEIHTLYATEAEVEVLKAHQKAAEALTNLNDILKKHDRLGITRDSHYIDMFRINHSDIHVKTEWYLGKGRIGL